MQYIPPPEASASIEDFYKSYWSRVRRDLRNEAEGSVVRSLTGRFDHLVTFCPDGVLVLFRHSSSDAFTWAETSRGVIELTKKRFGSPENWIALEVDQLVPGSSGFPAFDLDVACRTDLDDPLDEITFDRLQLRYVPFAFDHQFWTAANGTRLGARHLKGAAV